MCPCVPTGTRKFIASNYLINTSLQGHGQTSIELMRIDTTPVLVAHQRCEIPDKPRQTAEKRISLVKQLIPDILFALPRCRIKLVKKR